MTYLAFRNLFQQKLRLTLSIGGVALTMTLIVLLNGFLAGTCVRVTAYRVPRMMSSGWVKTSITSLTRLGSA
jgi:hypothetical protein